MNRIIYGKYIIPEGYVISKVKSPLADNFSLNYRKEVSLISPSLKSLVWAPVNEREKETSLIATGYHTCPLTKPLA